MEETEELLERQSLLSRLRSHLSEEGLQKSIMSNGHYNWHFDAKCSMFFNRLTKVIIYWNKHLIFLGSIVFIYLLPNLLTYNLIELYNWK